MLLPENFEQAVQTTQEELDALIRLMAALKMFEIMYPFSITRSMNSTPS